MLKFGALISAGPLPAIELNYRRSQFFEHYFDDLSSRLACPEQHFWQT